MQATAEVISQAHQRQLEPISQIVYRFADQPYGIVNVRSRASELLLNHASTPVTSTTHSNDSATPAEDSAKSLPTPNVPVRVQNTSAQMTRMSNMIQVHVDSQYIQCFPNTSNDVKLIDTQDQNNNQNKPVKNQKNTKFQLVF